MKKAVTRLRLSFAIVALMALLVFSNNVAFGSSELYPVTNREIGQFWNDLPGTGTPGISLATRRGINICHRTLLRFDTPTTGTFASAKLRIYCTTQGEYITNTLHASQVTEDWNTSATWSLRNASQQWTNWGGTYTNANEAVVSVPSKYTGGWHSQTGPYNEWIELDVTTIVQGWVNGTLPNKGLLLWETDITNDTENQSLDFVAMEDADTSHHPRLVVSTAAVPDAQLEILSVNQATDKTIHVQYRLTPHDPPPAGGYQVSILAMNTTMTAASAQALPDSDFDNVTAFSTGNMSMTSAGGTGEIVWDVKGMSAGALRTKYYRANVSVLFRLKADPLN